MKSEALHGKSRKYSTGEILNFSAESAEDTETSVKKLGEMI